MIELLTLLLNIVFLFFISWSLNILIKIHIYVLSLVFVVLNGKASAWRLLMLLAFIIIFFWLV